MSGPTREHVEGDPGQDDPRVVMPFNGSSASGDVTGEVVYANYGRLEDFNELAARHIDLHGKIVICRYGANFRGVKVYLAEQRGAIGVLLYSDPQGRRLLQGRCLAHRPLAARNRRAARLGAISVQVPRRSRNPGVASTLDLPDSARVQNFAGPEGDQPRIISIPLSYHDAAPILQALKGPDVPQDWQGALPFRYHMGPGGVNVHLVSRAGLPAAHHLGRDRKDRGRARSGCLGDCRKSSRRVGLWHGRSQQRHRLDARSGARRGRAAAPGLAAQTHHRLLQLGRRGGGPHRLNGMGRAAGPRPRSRRGLLQCGCGRLGPGL